MCSYLGESYQAGSRNIGSARAGRPGGCIPGCLVPTHVHAAARDHLYGHSSQGSSTPQGPQLGPPRHPDLVIDPGDSGTGLPEWLKPRQYHHLHRRSNTTTAAPTEQVEYVAILPDGSTMVKTSLFPRKQVRCDGSATRPIYLGNDTDSGISCIDQSTPVKAPGGKRQPLASTPSRSPNSWLLHSSTGMSWWPCGRELHVAGSSTRHAYPALTTWSILGPSMGNGSIQLETNRESWTSRNSSFV